MWPPPCASMLKRHQKPSVLAAAGVVLAMSGAIDFAALRLEREARQKARPAAAESAPRAPALASATMTIPQPAVCGSPVIYVGGALKDSSGRYSLRPPQVPAHTVEVDCRRSETEVKMSGNIARLSAGLGNLDDKRPETEAEKRLAIDFLLRNAAQVDLALSRGSSVWVHCAQGFNRGPSGLLAWMLLYTDASYEQACDRVKAARPRARTHKNTFSAELQQLLVLHSKKRFTDHQSFVIVDGGNDPSDLTRYG